MWRTYVHITRGPTTPHTTDLNRHVIERVYPQEHVVLNKLTCDTESGKGETRYISEFSLDSYVLVVELNEFKESGEKEKSAQISCIKRPLLQKVTN